MEGALMETRFFLKLILFVERFALGVSQFRPGRLAQRLQCKVLLLVAHADDEIIFAGEALLGRKVQLNCDAHWHIVTATFSSTQRVKEFWAVLDLLQRNTRAAGITGEVWDYDDCNYPYCHLFLGNPPFQERLIEVLQRDQWDYVITHNLQGEYHHKQHIGLHMAVEELFRQRPDVVGKASFWVFNPIPELNVSMSPGKSMLLQEYLDHTPTMARTLTFNSLRRYTEHLVPADEFSRPSLLGVPFSQEVFLQIGIPFWYTFQQLPGAELPAAEIYTLLKEYFSKTWESTCGRGSFVRYPEICRSLREQTRSISPELDETVKILQAVKQAEEVPIPSTPKAPATLRCLETTALKRFGKLRGWEVQTESAGVFMELLVLRPILVGWKQGNSNSYYKILGQVHHQLKAAIDIQLNDVVGWGVFLSHNSSLELSSASSHRSSDQAAQVCIGARGCEKADFCTFDSLPPKDLGSTLRIRSVITHVEDHRPAPGRMKYFKVMEALDISRFVTVNTTYEELLTLRQRLDHPDLGVFEDKIRLRKELLPAAGVLATPSIHLSNDDFEITGFLHGRKNYVVKPSHMSESQNVFVVQDGRNLLRMAWGHPSEVYLEEIQDAVNSFSTKTALEWECRALVSSKPGVIVEELVLATKADAPGKYLVDEYKFYTSWGVTIFAENIPFSSGAVMEISRQGHILTTKADCPPFCLARCFPQMVQIAEKVATYARTDFLRVDILVSGDCEALYVSEVELFPASDFSQVLKDAVAHRWRQGYGVK